MDSRWSVGGVLSMSKVPAEFADFVKAKQKQLLSNVVTSSFIGVALGNIAALFAGDASWTVLGATLEAQVPCYILLVVISFLTAFGRK